MRGPSGVILQFHQILRLPGKNAGDWCLSNMRRPLQCAEQQESHLQHQPILRLSRKVTPMIDPCLTWNVQYNARSIRSHPPTWPNIAPAKKKWPWWLVLVSNETSSTMRRPSGVIPQFHQILRLQGKKRWWLMLVRDETSITLRRATGATPPTSPNIATATKHDSDDWSLSYMKRPVQCAEHQESSSNLTKYCTCQKNWLWCLILVSNETCSTMRESDSNFTKYCACMRLPQKLAPMIDPCLKWHVEYIARSIMNHPPTSRNIAPATKKDAADWCSSDMKRPLQCAEQQESPSNITKQCACHEFSWIPDFTGKSLNCFRQNRGDSKIIRPWSDDNPTIKSSSGTRGSRELTCPISETNFVWKNSTFRAPAICQNFTKCCACHETKTLQLCQVLRLPRKQNLMIDPPHIWNIHPVQGAKHQESSSSITKYCAGNSTVRSATILYSTLLNSTIL